MVARKKTCFILALITRVALDHRSDKIGERKANPRIKPASLVSPALTCGFFTISITWEAHIPGGAYLHLQRDRVITGSHPRDLASPS